LFHVTFRVLKSFVNGIKLLLTCFIENSAEQPQIEWIAGQGEDVSVSHGSPLQHSASIGISAEQPEEMWIARQGEKQRWAF
jgi:hypothetical protein